MKISIWLKCSSMSLSIFCVYKYQATNTYTDKSNPPNACIYELYLAQSFEFYLENEFKNILFQDTTYHVESHTVVPQLQLIAFYMLKLSVTLLRHQELNFAECMLRVTRETACNKKRWIILEPRKLLISWIYFEILIIYGKKIVIFL